MLLYPCSSPQQCPQLSKQLTCLHCAGGALPASSAASAAAAPAGTASPRASTEASQGAQGMGSGAGPAVAGPPRKQQAPIGRAPSVPTAAGSTAPDSTVGSLGTASRGPSPAPGFRETGMPAAGTGGASSALLGPTAAGLQDVPAASVPVPSTSLLGGQAIAGPTALRGKTPSPAPGAQGLSSVVSSETSCCLLGWRFQTGR